MTFVHFYDGNIWQIHSQQRGKSVMVPHHEGDIFLHALLKTDIKAKLSDNFVNHLEDVAQQVVLIDSWMGVLELKTASESDRSVMRAVVERLGKTVVGPEIEAGKIHEAAYKQLVANI